MLWDTFDFPIIPKDDFTAVFLITKSALEEKGITSRIYGGINFRAIVGDTTEYHGFPIFWIDKGELSLALFLSFFLFFVCIY